MKDQVNNLMLPVLVLALFWYSSTHGIASIIVKIVLSDMLCWVSLIILLNEPKCQQSYGNYSIIKLVPLFVFRLRVPETLPLYDILNEFQKGHSHMAVVVRQCNKVTPDSHSTHSAEGNKSFCFPINFFFFFL